MAELKQVLVPDIGDFDEIPVIEILVSPGTTVTLDEPLLTLESDKATMDIPAPFAGTVRELLVEVGSSVSEGSPLLTIEIETAEIETAAAPDSTPAEPEPSAASPAETDVASSSAPAAPASAPGPVATADTNSSLSPSDDGPRPSPTAELQVEQPSAAPHATPAIRRFARELGVTLENVVGTGRKGRILKEDIQSHVKSALEATRSAPAVAAKAATGSGIEPIPAVDFSKFGDTQEEPLGRIKRISGPFLHRSWINIPHVTHHDEADITELEAFRQSLKKDAEQRGVRVTLLFFLMKALVATMKQFPNFNASLSPAGDALIMKKYFHIGIAVDTPQGLVVPVVRDVDKKGVFALAEEVAEISARARDGKLKPDELQGGCITISSLGGIGGIGFTPIINAPEVAILGVARSRMAPVWDGAQFQPRLMLPLDLSYDHRVIDGAEAARFVSYYANLLGDMRKILL